MKTASNERAIADTGDTTIADIVASWPRLSEHKRHQLSRLLRDAPTAPTLAATS